MKDFQLVKIAELFSKCAFLTNYFSRFIHVYSNQVRSRIKLKTKGSIITWNKIKRKKR